MKSFLDVFESNFAVGVKIEAHPVVLNDNYNSGVGLLDVLDDISLSVNEDFEEHTGTLLSFIVEDDHLLLHLGVLFFSELAGRGVLFKNCSLSGSNFLLGGFAILLDLSGYESSLLLNLLVLSKVVHVGIGLFIDLRDELGLRSVLEGLGSFVEPDVEEVSGHHFQLLERLAGGDLVLVLFGLDCLIGAGLAVSEGVSSVFEGGVVLLGHLVDGTDDTG